jgi:hypothetical protein
MKNLLIAPLLLTFLFSGCSENTDDKKNNGSTQNENTMDRNSKKKGTNLPQDERNEKKLTVEERIEEIRNWYTEIQKIGLKNCQTKRKTRFENGLIPESERMPFEQVVKTCKLNEDFDIIKGEFSGYEWAQQVSICKKNGKVFFIFVTGGAESWSYEYRYYFDTDENLIRHLEREAEGGEEISGPNKQIKIDPKKRSVHDCAKDYLKEIEFVTGRK